MSKSGDVVWSDGRTWQRFSDLTWQRKDPDSYLIPEEWRNEKRWWVRPMLGGIASQTLANIKQHDDFAWLVKDGIPIVLNALAVYQALDSFADFVAKRGADAELTAERDELLSRLAEMTAQRDAARKDAQEAVAEHKKLVDHYAADFPRRAADNKELRELRQTCSDLGKENEQLSAALNDEKRIGRQEERESIVTWLSSQYRTANGSFTHAIAEEIRNGKHLAGDDV